MATKTDPQTPRAIEPDRLLTTSALARAFGLKRELMAEYLRRIAPHLPPADLLGMNRYPRWRFGDICAEMGVNPHNCTPLQKEANDARKMKKMEEEATAHRQNVETGLFHRELKF